MSVILLYTLLYIEKEQKQTEKEGQRLDGLPSCPPRPRPLPLLLVVREGKSKRANRTGRERTRAKDAAAIFARSSPLFCSVCCPHRPHHRQPLTTSPPSHQQPGREEGRPPRPVLGDPLSLTLTTLSTLPGCFRIYADTSGEGRGACQHSRAAGLLGVKFCFGIFCTVVSL